MEKQIMGKYGSNGKQEKRKIKNKKKDRVPTLSFQT